MSASNAWGFCDERNIRLEGGCSYTRIEIGIAGVLRATPED